MRDGDSCQHPGEATLGAVVPNILRVVVEPGSGCEVSSPSTPTRRRSTLPPESHPLGRLGATGEASYGSSPFTGSLGRRRYRDRPRGRHGERVAPGPPASAASVPGRSPLPCRRSDPAGSPHVASPGRHGQPRRAPASRHEEWNSAMAVGTDSRAVTSDLNRATIVRARRLLVPRSRVPVSASCNPGMTTYAFRVVTNESASRILPAEAPAPPVPSSVGLADDSDIRNARRPFTSAPQARSCRRRLACVSSCIAWVPSG
jgi:hypothetical protein